MTIQQKERFAKMASEFAREAVEVEEVKGMYYVYGSEVACLRVFAKYQGFGAGLNDKVRVGFSSNLNTWYVSILAS